MLSSAPRQTGQLRRPATRIPTVCVVDPLADDYRGWDSLVQASGLRLQIVPSAIDALRFSRTTAVDLWVINVELGDMSGCDLCRMLKDRSPHTPIVLVANHYSAAWEQAALSERATLFVCKPGHQACLDVLLTKRRSRQAGGSGLVQLPAPHTNGT